MQFLNPVLDSLNYLEIQTTTLGTTNKMIPSKSAQTKPKLFRTRSLIQFPEPPIPLQDVHDEFGKLSFPTVGKVAEIVAAAAKVRGPHRSLGTGMYVGIEIDWTNPSFSISWNDGYFELDYYTQEVHTDVHGAQLVEFLSDAIVKYLATSMDCENYKIHAAAISSKRPLVSTVTLNKTNYIFHLPARLWFELDVLPIFLTVRGDNPSERASSASRKLVSFMTPASALGGLPRVVVGQSHLVEVDMAGKCHMWTIQHAQKVYSASLWQTLGEWRDKSQDLRIAFFNSTPHGGGVALMRHSTIRLMTQLGLQSRWYVMKPNPRVFEVTKRKFHNILQGLPSNEPLSRRDVEQFEAWSRSNAIHNFLDSVFLWCNVAVLDDPQVLGLLPFLKLVNPDCKIIFRCHIQIQAHLISASTSESGCLPLQFSCSVSPPSEPISPISLLQVSAPGLHVPSPTKRAKSPNPITTVPRLSTQLDEEGSEITRVWNYLWVNYARHADLFVFHPVSTFIPKNVPREKLVFMSPTTDALDGLNKPLSPNILHYYFQLFNRIAFDQTRTRVSFFERPYVCQIARFDPSKGLEDCLVSYWKLRQRMTAHMSKIPQLVLVGHGSVDDPDGLIVFKSMQEVLKQEQFRAIASDVVMVRLPPSDQLLNAVLQGATIAMQLSRAEGFEIKVTEALAKGVPVICSDAGGIGHQGEWLIGGANVIF
jgi:glycosyltransferase involved in cell wall biosynthesis